MSLTRASVFDHFRRRLDSFQKAPLESLSRRIRASRQVYEWLNLSRAMRFRWPVYDLSRWLSNSTARKLYRNERAHMELNAVQQQILDELRQEGISIIRFHDLFPSRNLSELQELAEKYLKRSINQDKINAIRTGIRPAKAGKFYLVRLLGDRPKLDQQDKFVEITLSDEVLRIVCAYLAMFSRIVDIDLWCNVPTDGPDTYSQAWHRDPDDRKLVKIFLYLRDIDSATGPFCYIPGTQNGGRFGKILPQTVDTSRYPPAGEVERKFLQSQIKYCTGEAGTLIFCDTTGLHRGGHPQSGLRLLYTSAYTTNPGANFNGKRYSIGRLRSDILSAAAKYGIGHLKN
jgi:Phytanoyl-CoA dioxygenase (PhyH)